MIAARLTACRPGRARLTAGAPDGGITRYAPGVLAQMEAIREAGREPVIVRHRTEMEPGVSRSNPRGLPIMTVEEVR